jgi:outer membrane protein with beta-barrel domain
MRLRGIVLAMLVGVAWTSAARAGSYEQIRHGWLVGLGIGGGSANVSIPNTSTDREGGFAGSFRAGYAFTPEISLELNSNAWIKEQGGTTVTFSVSAVALNYYPGASGFVLRGGVGLGSVDLSSSFGNTTYSSSESGLGLTAGAAYEFRVTRRFSIGPQIDFGWTDQTDYNTNHINGGLGFTWYFIPR